MTETSDEWKVVIARSFDEVKAMHSIWQELQDKEESPTIYTDIDYFSYIVKSKEVIWKGYFVFN